MSILFASCSLLVFLSVSLADHPGHDKFSFCGNNVTACRAAGSNFTCVTQSSKDGCTKDVADNKANLTLATVDDLVKYGDNLKIVFTQKLVNLPKHVHYYGLAVVQKGTNFNLNNLKGKNTCHTGAGKTVGWKIPIGYLLFKNYMPWDSNQYKSASEYFGKSCVPGVRAKGVGDPVGKDLCSLCNGTCATNSSEERYYNYAGAFKCMAEGNKDRVGFVKETTANEVMDANPGKYGSMDDYEVLCTDGKKKKLTEYRKCFIEARPTYAIVTNKDTSDGNLQKMKTLLTELGYDRLKAGEMVSSNIERLLNYTDSVKNYVGVYGDYYNALSDGGPTGTSSHNAAITFLVQLLGLFTAMVLLA